nr:phosphatase PAP2 family protein [Massilia oculi]
MRERTQGGQSRLPPAQLPVRERIRHLLLNWLVFGLCYPIANLLAQQQQRQVQRSLAIALDASIPFLPWMGLPYASAGLLFTLVFFLVRSAEQLRVASRRLTLATVTACLVFVFFPARFSLARPVVADAVPATLFRWLELVDQPFNQFPSLHVAYCVIIWCALRPLCHGVVRALLAAWLLLVAASTLFTWQHHLPDVAGGLLWGAATVLAIRPGATRRHTVAFHYAIMAALLVLLGVGALRSWIAAYAAVSLLLIAAAYHEKCAGFLRKRGGRHPLRAWLLFWPYLAGYWLTWMLVRLRDRRRPPFVRQAPGLWTGRRLSDAEATGLPQGCHVIDLSGELAEAPALRRHGYSHFPLLDLQAPRPGQLRQVLAALARLHENGVPVYLHCAMGYSRCHLIARLYMRKRRRCPIRSTS